MTKKISLTKYAQGLGVIKPGEKISSLSKDDQEKVKKMLQEDIKKYGIDKVNLWAERYINYKKQIIDHQNYD